MHIGHYISGAGHAGLIGWLLFGQVFTAEPLPFEVTEVSVLSEAEFAALTAPTAPQPETPPQDLAALTPPTPEPQPDPPPAPAPDPAPAPQPEPQAAPAPEPDPVPETVPAPPAPPEPEVADAPPVLAVPEPVPQVVAPRTAERPKPRPAPRVAPTPVAPSEPDTVVDRETQEAAVPDEAADTPAPEAEASAPEEAATEIVTEAEEPAASSAPVAAARPRTRPARPDPPAQTTADSTAEAVNDALAAALSGGAAEADPGPPLTTGEMDALRVAVQDCWVVDVGSQAANVIVVVAMSMERDGRVQANSIRMIAADGGDARAADTAFQAARRAIIRCGQDGYDLPVEKYEQWRNIEMTFNPSSMRIR